MAEVSTYRASVQQGIWREFDRMTALTLKHTLESFMEQERDSLLACSYHERSERRRGYRNGYDHRYLETRKGRLKLRVPKVRNCSQPLQTLVFDAYKRRTRDIEQAVEHWVAAGQSTRSIELSLQLAFGCMFSASTVSRVIAKVDAELQAFHVRRLEHGYRVIYLDGKYGYICRRRKHGRRGRKKSAVMLSCWGIRHDGSEELVDFMACEGGESEENWTRFLTSLEARGVRARNPWHMPLELIVTDGDKGLEAALLTVYPHTPKQLCHFHKIQAMSRHLEDFANRKAITSSAGAIYSEARTAAQSKARLREWIAQWQDKEPAAVKSFCRSFGYTLTHFNLEPELRKRVRTTNPIERFHLELEKATGHAGAWQNSKSWERHVYLVWRRLKRSGYKPTLPNQLFTRNS